MKIDGYYRLLITQWNIKVVSEEGIVATGVLQVCQCVLTGCVERQGQVAEVCGTGQREDGDGSRQNVRH